ncbi:MAG: chemotaxis protein [Tissierellales bacterium]|jgi:two-component system chemotaxis response regulator CheV|nr:chemotaxis protein [Tissierellales bacterium]
MNEKDGILLESGTGEVEVIEFKVGNEHYAINVVKVKEIIEVDKVIKVPTAPPEVPGITSIRGEVITLIDMKYVLENVKKEPIEKSMTLMCEFNQLKVAFAIDEVLGIHRINWNQIQKPDTLIDDTLVIGNIEIGENILMLLDFEKIVMDISPSSGINVGRIENIEHKDRSKSKLVLADDSPMIRKVLNDVLSEAGYVNLKFFDDGQQAYDYLSQLADIKGEDFLNEVDLLITDIEMPMMDGHTLTRKLKENRVTKNLPIIIFSSLITNDLKHKGDAVGADAQMSKPEVGKLVELVDSLILK